MLIYYRIKLYGGETMSSEKAKDDNLLHLKTGEKQSKELAIHNKMAALEKTLNDVQSNLSKSTASLNLDIKNIIDKDSSIHINIEDLLKKISNTESEISQLYKDIDMTNVEFSKNVAALEANQTDISSKVSETYKQLGAIEKQYKSLKTKSTKITKDIKTITAHVDTVSNDIRQQIQNVEQKTAQLDNQIDSVESEAKIQSVQLMQGQDELIERTNDIVREAKKTSSALEKSIIANAEIMKNIESQLVTELETLAKDTESKTTKIESDIEQTNTEIKSQSAKMLLLQSVDEALDKRAKKLESTAKSLTSETKKLTQASVSLDQRSTALEDSVDVLNVQVTKLEEEFETQQARLEVLNTKTGHTNNALLALAGLESKHFKVASSLIALVIIAIVGLYLFQDYRWSTDSISTAQRQQQVTQHLTNLNQNIGELQQKVENKVDTLQQQVENKVDTLQQHVKTEDTIAANRMTLLEEEVTALNQQMKTVNDKNNSLDNRLVNIAPLRQIGSDNVIHSQHWINQQADSQYAIKAVIADSEVELFDLAVRYNYYLTDVLSFKAISTDEKTSYALYMGQYEDKAVAQEALDDMPFRLNGFKPEMVQFSTLK